MNVLPMIVSVPPLSMPPPLAAELPVNVLPCIVRVPLLLMPPPLPPDFPFSMVRLLRIATLPLLSVEDCARRGPAHRQ